MFFEQVKHAPARQQDEEYEFDMQYINIVIENGAEQNLRRTVNDPCQVALQRESHSPGIEPIRYFKVVNGLTDKKIKLIYNELFILR